MFDLTYACLLGVDGFGVDGRGHFGSLSGPLAETKAHEALVDLDWKSAPAIEGKLGLRSESRRLGL
jgi:hypothetical protein